jgi:hypothetical protein
VIEGKLEGRIEMMGRRGRRRKQLLDDLKEKGRYWKLKEEALDRTVENSLWKRLRICSKTDCRMNELLCLYEYTVHSQILVGMTLMIMNYLCGSTYCFKGKKSFDTYTGRGPQFFKNSLIATSKYLDAIRVT